MNNLDEDIKILEEFTKVEFIMTDRKEITKPAHKEISQAISNVLTQLNVNKYDINNYEERITSLKLELETYKEEFKKINKALNLEEGIVEPYTTDIIEGLKRCVTQQQKELETYKKIAEKLAEEMMKLPEGNYYYDSKEGWLDWARKEVENDVE